MELQGKRVLVVGLGKSGVASALFAKARGASVTVSDSKSQDLLHDEIPTLLERGITVETGGHGERTFRQQDLIIVSPGVPMNMPLLVQAQRMGIPIIGEMELAAQHLKGHIIAITGSNGKTTTTSLVGEIVAASGLHALIGGNIGTPAITFVPESKDKSYIVLEVSSFQLETIQMFHPEIAAVLNVTPDHLDRHGDLEAYWAAKRRIFENQTAKDFAVLNADDAQSTRMAEGLKSQIRWFSRKKEVEAGSFLRDGKIVFRDGRAEQEVMPVTETRLKGAHNIENILAAVCISMLAGCDPARIRSAVREFKAVEHRLEYVATIRGVEYYNDSKATNVDATIKALESFAKNVHLILGGKDKGSDYSVLKPLLERRVKRVYTVGAAAEKIETQIASSGPIVRSGTIETALRKIFDTATESDVVLLAPACASFDQFKSYEERGQVFKGIVHELAEKAAREEIHS